MIGLPALNEKIFTMKQLAATISEKKNAVKNRVAAAEAEGRTEKWTKERIREIQGEGAVEINAHLLKITEAHESFSQQEMFWSNKEAVLSKIPLTKRGGDNWTPENPAGEALARTALLAEASRMSNGRLELMAQDAISSGELAAAYLFALEGGSRPKPTKIDTSAIAIPEQQAALNLFLEAKRCLGHAILDMREASGARPDEVAIGRLNAERGIL
jgi:hypothetical protein